MSRVIILTPDLAANATGRAVVFADLLRGHRDVAIAGRRTGPMWTPASDRRDIEVIDLGRSWVAPSRAVRRSLRDATIIAVKPLFSTYGSALLARSRRLVLDIDDPEVALIFADLRTLVRSATRLDGLPLTPAFLALRRFARALTVSSEVLQRTYGGTIIPHVRDEAAFGTERRDRASARRRVGIDPDSKLIVFVGTVRPHKGVEVLAECADLVAPALIAFVGASEPIADAGNLRWIPPVPYQAALDWVAAADVVAVPQLGTTIGRFQTPAKITDALAMGRAIVASDLPPIREVVGASGLLVKPSSREELGAGLRAVLESPGLRDRLEASARQQYLERFTLAAVRPRLLGLLESIGA